MFNNMNMRSLILILMSFIGLTVYAQTAEQKIMAALENIKEGYIQYGFSNIKIVAGYNNIYAQYYLGVCYEHGIGVERNPSNAFLYYRRSAERGLSEAMEKLATFYHNGIVVNKDENKSNEWQQRSLKRKSSQPLPDLFAMYNEGVKHIERFALNPSVNQTNVASNGQNNSVGQVVNNITIIQESAKPIAESSNTPTAPAVAEIKESDVDTNIPINTVENSNTFAIVIANESYQDVVSVPNAIRDGEVFREYCNKTLGLPQNNIHFMKNATLNNIKRELSWIKKVAEAYNGEARIIVYYAGHGLPDEATKSAYLLPVDGTGSDITTCYSLSELYDVFSGIPTKQVVFFIDACFSGYQRGDTKMLVSARGIALKAKTGAPTGNMIVLSASQGDETANSYNEQHHGLFTYYLLKKLQETKGNVNLNELYAFIKNNVIKKSLVANHKQQTPSINPSLSLGENWKSWTLK